MMAHNFEKKQPPLTEEEKTLRETNRIKQAIRLIKDQDVFSASIASCKKVGIYFLIKNSEILYIGQSINIQYRIGCHARDGIIDFDRFTILEVDKQFLCMVEARLIKRFKPKHNVMHNGFITLCL